MTLRREQNNPEPEFESILRRHIRGSAAVSCSGFDADMASSYLERLLRGSALTDYERHLGECPTCRRHLIELSRLMMLTAPQGRVAKPDGLAANPGSLGQTVGQIVESWREWARSLGQSLEDWRIGWQWAGAGTLATALVVAILVHQWRPGNPNSNSAINGSQPADPGQMPGNLVAANPAASVPEAVPGSSPSPLTTTKSAGQDTGQDTRSRPTAAGFSGQASAPEQDVAVATPETRSAPTTPPQLPGPLSPPIATVDSRQMPSLSPGIPQGVDGVARAREISPITISEQGGSGRSPSLRLGGARSGRLGSPVESLFPGSAPVSGSQVTPEDVRVIQGKTFVRRSGSWIDTQYLSSFLRGRIIPLVFGSEEYRRVLEESPELEAFFSLRPVTVVWNNRAYIVRPASPESRDRK